MKSLLLKSEPFSVLPAHDISVLASHAKEISFKKGEVVFHEGQPAKAVWVIKEGWLKLTKQAFGDKSVTIDLLTPREAICGISVFDQLPYSATAIAVTDCVMASIPSQDVLALIRTNPTFDEKLLAICCHRIRHMAESIAMLYEPVELRIAKTLLRLEEIFGDVLPVTHREIAGITGIRVETTIRAISKMKKQDWLEMSRGKITLLRPAKIRGLLEGNCCCSTAKN